MTFTVCTLGWANLYQKFEIEKYTVVNSFYQKNRKAFFVIFFWLNWLAILHGFANICKLSISNTFKGMHSQI